MNEEEEIKLREAKKRLKKILLLGTDESEKEPVGLSSAINENTKEILITTVVTDGPFAAQLKDMRKEFVNQAEEKAKEKMFKQFYHSEEWKDVAESLNRTWKSIKEAIAPVVERTAETVKELFIKIKALLATDPEIKKCYGIYYRTRRGRIRKKQLKRIEKIIRRKYYNGNMDKDTKKE